MIDPPKIQNDSFHDKNAKKNWTKSGMNYKGSNLFSIPVTKGSKCFGWVYGYLVYARFLYVSVYDTVYKLKIKKKKIQIERKMTLTLDLRSPIFRRIEVWVQSNNPPSFSLIAFLTSEIY